MSNANAKLLAELNAFRVAEGLAPLADWRKARHMDQLVEVRKILADRAAQAEPQVDEAAPVAKLPTYKQTANHARSSLMKPVEFIKSFLDANPDLSRKAAVIELQKQGINFSTARTQYQRWYKANKGA